MKIFGRQFFITLGTPRVGSLSKATLSAFLVAGFSPTHLKNMRTVKLDHLPIRIGGENWTKNVLSCHQLYSFLLKWQQPSREFFAALVFFVGTQPPLSSLQKQPMCDKTSGGFCWTDFFTPSLPISTRG